MAQSTEAQSTGAQSGTTKTGLKWINYPGYDESDAYKIAAAVVVPPGRRLVATSGHVGRDISGKAPESLEEEFTAAFQKVEASLHAVDPSFTSEELWHSVYQINSFHAGGISKEVFQTLVDVAVRFTRGHRPAWTAVEVKSLNMGVRMEIAVMAALP